MKSGENGIKTKGGELIDDYDLCGNRGLKGANLVRNTDIGNRLGVYNVNLKVGDMSKAL